MSEHHEPTQPPRILAVSAGVVVLQGVLTIGFGIAEVASTQTQRLVMAGTTAIFFVAYGVALLICARGLWRCLPWARGPVLMAQLIWLGLAWNFRDVDRDWLVALAVAMALSAVVVIFGLLHPASTRVLAREEP